MSDENELLEPLATEAGQQAIARAINNLSSLEYAVRAERAATTATQKADEALNSAEDANDYATEARNWATKTDGYVDQETITIPPEQEGDEPTTETIDLYSARYYAALAQDIYNNLQFDTEPTENSTNIVSSGAIYTALNGKADKSTTYTKTETDTLINTKLAELVSSAPATLDTLQELATALGNDPNFATTIATQLGNKADKSDTYTKTEVDTALGNVQSTLTFDSTPTANSNNPVTSGGVYTALQNVNIDIDDEITEDSDNPVTSAAIYEALQNFTPSGGGSVGNASGMVREELYNSTPMGNGTLQLSEPIDKYDFIEFRVVNNTGNMAHHIVPCYISSHLLLKTKTIESGLSAQSIYIQYEYGERWAGVQVDVNDNSKLIISNASNHLIKEVNGIKFSKNLSEQMYSNVLYFNNTGVQSGTVLLNDNWDNYDFLLWDCASNLDAYSSNGTHTNLLTSVEEAKNKNNLFVSDFSNRAISVTFSLNNTKELTISNNGGTSLYKIIGYKMAKGGYSGIVSDARMTVKSGTGELASNINSGSWGYIPVTFDSPMPDTNYVISVSISNHDSINGADKARIGISNYDKTVNGFKISIVTRDGYPVYSGLKVDWIAIRPNSYTREGMVEDVLFSNASGVNSGTINLSGNISDYDLIDIQIGKSGTSFNSNIYTSSMLNNLIGNSIGIVIPRYHEDQMSIMITNDNTLSFGSVSTNVLLYKITGIKFGRYVSGVSVDNTVTQNSNAVVTSGAVYDALQNVPSGGGSSITVDSTITQGGTNPVQGGAIYTALDNKADKSTTYTKTEVDTALGSKQGTLTFDTAPTADSANPVTSGGVYTALQNLPTGTGDVTTNTDQNITGTKTFVGSKKVAFKQSATNDKLGFTLFGNTGTERGYLEFNPTNTIDGVAGLMTLGNYATSAAALTQVGFRRYSNISGQSGAYNLLMPMVADARTPFSLTTSYQNFYLPLGFTNGTTTVRTAKSGVVDLSPLLASLEARIAALEGN